MSERNKIYFASDFHLGSRAVEDPLAQERLIVQWLETVVKPDAKALYLLGDIFDYWWEYKYVVPRGFTRFLGKLGELHDSGIEIHWFTGNHDIWIFDYIPQETGAIIHREPLVLQLGDKRAYLAHGDGLGDDSAAFKILRSMFHNRFLQVLFAAIHPRWTMAFGLAWSRHSRTKREKANTPYLGEEKEHLIHYSKAYLKKDPVDYILFGHRHILLDLMLSRESRMLIIGDWFEYNSYAVWDGEQFRLEIFGAEA
ncbi:MAG: UDP-2,3-diacylglucosamine diphosphatase [Bacteroidales bacterium]|jgi:UDP-2,3-diacylglucosamine hydrolase|nr:UDP-2,3-diacylglucosamine diphosphatase [Bacteroidales bacterium]